MEDQTAAQPIMELHTARDYETIKAHYLASKRGAFWRCFILFLALTIGFTVAWYVFDRDMEFLGLAGFFLLMGAIIIPLPLLQIKKTKKELQKNDVTLCNDSYRFFPDRIEYEGRNEDSQITSTVKYTHFVSAGEGRAFFTLMDQNGWVHLFSKDDLANNDQVEALRALFTEKYGKKFKQHKR